jgi:hypothetical protein
VTELKKRGASDIRVLGGGIRPDDDIETLKAAGIDAIFTPGAPLAEIIEAFKKACDKFYGRKEAEYFSAHKINLLNRTVSRIRCNDKRQADYRMGTKLSLQKTLQGLLKGKNISETTAMRRYRGYCSRKSWMINIYLTSVFQADIPLQGVFSPPCTGPPLDNEAVCRFFNRR